jgi:hypothetical protein
LLRPSTVNRQIAGNPMGEDRSPLGSGVPYFQENTMLTGSVICKLAPVGVLLGGSGIYSTVLQRAPQVSALLCFAQDLDELSSAIPVHTVAPHAEVDHDD